MFGINWSDPQTFWLNVTNAGLGLVVLACCIAVGIGVVQELAARRRKATARDLDGEVRDLVAGYGDTHAFHVPGLGLTMADGGERIDKDKKQ